MLEPIASVNKIATLQYNQRRVNELGGTMGKQEIKYLGYKERVTSAIVLLLIFIVFTGFLNKWDYGFLIEANSKFNTIFVSGALLLILGKYIAEPFFTQPVDVLTNAITVIVFLLGVKIRDSLFMYNAFFIICLAILVATLFLIIRFNTGNRSKWENLLYKLTTTFGKSEVIFSVLYLLIITSYFRTDVWEYVVLMSFFFFLLSTRSVVAVARIILKIFSIITNKKTADTFIGNAIGCENPFLYEVEVSMEKEPTVSAGKGDLVYLEMNENKGYLGIIVNSKKLLRKKWFTVYLLKKGKNALQISLKDNSLLEYESNSIYSKTNKVHIFSEEDLDDECKDQVHSNYLYKNRSRFLGYVDKGSSINSICIKSVLDESSTNYKLLREGTIIKADIYGDESLFQVIDGRTEREVLENHDMHGYTSILAQKLGKYNYDEKELETVRWLPDIYTPVFFDEISDVAVTPESVGRLPQTDMEIVLKSPNTLVTHNTAILGILGIGKSCLTFELIQKIINTTSAKVVCIDITGEYPKELSYYIPEALIEVDLASNLKAELKATRETPGDTRSPNGWGNEGKYKEVLEAEFNRFNESSKRVFILNPDYHLVNKALGNFNILETMELTIAEKTRIIAEKLFSLCKVLWNSEERNTSEEIPARFLLVLEEAHSLVPEWNSTANGGDDKASNGTAKVVLQGRKYGLGSFVIAQRTANISKSILNQCNTVFALRVFDDTGKQFLENYIGREYSNLLPTLEPRHAIVVGKALKLKQPVIVELNDKAKVVLQAPTTTE